MLCLEPVNAQESIPIRRDPFKQWEDAPAAASRGVAGGSAPTGRRQLAFAVQTRDAYIMRAMEEQTSSRIISSFHAGAREYRKQ